jgi:hypothetical protein
MIGVDHPLSERTSEVCPFIVDVVAGEELGELAQVSLTTLIIESADRITDFGGHEKDIGWINDGAMAIHTIIKDKPDVRCVKVGVHMELNAIDEVVMSSGKFLQRQRAWRSRNRNLDA